MSKSNRTRIEELESQVAILTVQIKALLMAQEIQAHNTHAITESVIDLNFLFHEQFSVGPAPTADFEPVDPDSEPDFTDIWEFDQSRFDEALLYRTENVVLP